VNTEKSFSDYRQKELRLLILMILSEQSDQRMDSSRLHAGLLYMGFMAEEHEVVGALQFLQLHQLIDLRQMGEIRPNLYTATLRKRGLHVVRGHVHVDGILDVVERD